MNFQKFLKIFSWQILICKRNGFVKDTNKNDNDSTFNAEENPWFVVCGIPQGFTGQGPIVGYT